MGVGVMKFIIAICVLLTFGVACGRPDASPVVMKNAKTSMRQICVGRLHMSIPSIMERQRKPVDGGGDVTFYFGHDIDFTKVDAAVIGESDFEEFDSVVAERIQELKSEENFSSGGDMLFSVEKINPEATMVVYYDNHLTETVLRMEMHALVSGRHVVLSETSYSEDTRVSVKTRLQQLLSSVHPENGGQLRGEGFCLDEIVFDFDNDYEESDIYYGGVIEGVSVEFELYIDTFKKASDEPALIERGESNLRGLGAEPVKIRSGKTVLAGQPGEEWLGYFLHEGRRLHSFYAETASGHPTKASPRVQLSFFSGYEDAISVTPSLDDDFSISLWEEVLNSMKKNTDAP